MKKALMIFMTLILILGFAACEGKNDAEPTNPTETTGPADSPGNTEPTGSGNGILEGSLEDILDQIYAAADVDDYFKEYIENGLMTVEITTNNIKYHLGKEDIEYKEAIASEPMIQPSAYSLCLVRVKEGDDIEKIKADIRENVDPMKWVCVGVDPQNVIVDSIGDVIVLIMSNDHSQALHEAFLALKG